jgi:hypothetical protein
LTPDTRISGPAVASGPRYFPRINCDFSQTYTEIDRTKNIRAVVRVVSAVTG